MRKLGQAFKINRLLQVSLLAGVAFLLVAIAVSVVGVVSTTYSAPALVMVAGPMIALGTVLAADRNTQSKEAPLLSYPCAVDIFYKGAMVCVNAAGYLAPAADTLMFGPVVGVADENVDNSGGSAGTLNCRVRSGRAFQFVATSIAQTDVGKTMFVVDDQTFDDRHGNGIVAGTLVQYVSATSGWVFIPNPPNLDESGIHVADTQLTNAQVVLFRATPITLVGAPGAGKAIVVHKFSLVCDDAGGAWTESTDNLVIQYADGVDITAAIEATTLVGGAVTFITQGVLDTVVVPDVNAAVQIFNTGDGEWGGGNAANTMSVRIWYSVMETVAFS